jgi:hypothetical protein
VPPPGAVPPAGVPPPVQPPPAQAPFAQPPYVQPPYVQPPYVQPPYVQPPYVQPPAVAPPAAHPAADDPDDSDALASNKLNYFLTIFLGLALLGLVGTFVFFSVHHPDRALPTGLTSLASLIAGGMLTAINPVRSVRSKKRK